MARRARRSGDPDPDTSIKEELGPGENPQKYFGNYKQIYGPQPGSHATNRRFWDDPYVEPKQQHRFGVAFPVYMNMGRANSTTVAKSYIEAYGRVTAGLGDSATLTLSDLAKGLDDVSTKATDGYRVGPKSTSMMSIKGEGLYLRMSEYIGYSFVPPAMKFTQGYKPGPGGSMVPDDGENKYEMGDAQLTLVTTLRDDLHFSLSFLFSIAAFADITGDIKSGVKLFPSQVYAGDADDKILVVKEYSARPDPLRGDSFGKGGATGLGVGTTMADMLGHTPARLTGLHLLRDPVIKDVTFTEFTYGGTELVKAQLTLGYGVVAAQATDKEAPSAGEMRNFYSYEAAGTRYGRSYFTWKDDTADGKDQVPDFDKRRRKAFTDYPNWWSDKREKAVQKILPVKPGNAPPSKPTWGTQRTGPSPEGNPRTLETNAKRINFIRDRIDGEKASRPYSPMAQRRINELVTKSISGMLQESEATAAAIRENRAQEGARNAQRHQDSEEVRLANLASEAAGREARGTDRGFSGTTPEDQREQERRMIRTLRQGGATPAEIREARQNIRTEQNLRARGDDISDFGR